MRQRNDQNDVHFVHGQKMVIETPQPSFQQNLGFFRGDAF